jgi:hypothetical protein
MDTLTCRRYANDPATQLANFHLSRLFTSLAREYQKLTFAFAIIEVRVFRVNLPPVELHIRDPRTGERQRELFVLHAFNNVQDPDKMERCKTAVTHFFRTTAWREQIQTGEEDCLQVLVIQHGLKKFVCAYCHKEHTQIDAALGCIHGHMDYKPFLCKSWFASSRSMLNVCHRWPRRKEMQTSEASSSCGMV